MAPCEPNLDSVENEAEGDADLPVNMAVHCPDLSGESLRTPGLMVIEYFVIFAWTIEVR